MAYDKLNLVLASILIGVFMCQLSYSQEEAEEGPIQVPVGVERRYASRYYSIRPEGEKYHYAELYPAAVQVSPWETGPLDKWRFRKTFRVDATYDSNLFFGLRQSASGTADTDDFDRYSQDDIYFTYAGGVGAARRSGKTYLDVFYALGYTDYVENEKFSFFSPGPLSVGAGYRQGKINVTLQDVFSPHQNQFTGARTAQRTGSGVTSTATSNLLNVKIDYTYSPKTKFTFAYNNFLYYLPFSSNSTDSDGSGLDSSDLNNSSYLFQSFTPSISHKLTPKTSARVFYNHGIFDYFEAEDSGVPSAIAATTTTSGQSSYETDSVGVGFTSQVRAQTSISADVGYRFIDFSDPLRQPHEGVFARGEFRTRISPRMTGFVGADKDFLLNDFHTLRAGLSGRITPKILATLTAAQTVQEEFEDVATTTSQQESELYSARLSWFMRPRLTLHSGVSYGTISEGNVSTLANPEDPSFLFVEPVSGNEEFYTWDIRVEWRPRPRLSIVVGYEVRVETSEHPDFDEHRLFASVGLSVW